MHIDYGGYSTKIWIKQVSVPVVTISPRTFLMLVASLPTNPISVKLKKPIYDPPLSSLFRWEGALFPVL